MRERRREELGKKLRGLLGSGEVYFQRPESKKMSYPAIVYTLSAMKSLYADGGVYVTGREYQVTLIDKDPDSRLVDKLAALPTCRFDRHYKSDNLNHWVFRLYF